MEDRNARNPEYDAAELVQQLREKVRTQAQRLRSLEQYRALCEQRITELQPGHSLPVKPEDLGTGLISQSLVELQQAKQKIARLEEQLSQQSIKVPLGDNYTFPPPSTQLTLAQLQELYSAIYYQHHEIHKEKNTVEDSLRAEMLICEEQRAYIEVLKQALENNLQDMGMSGRTIGDFLSKTADNPRVTMHYEDGIVEQLRSKTEECELLLNERAEANKHLQEAAEAHERAGGRGRAASRGR